MGSATASSSLWTLSSDDSGNWVVQGLSTWGVQKMGVNRKKQRRKRKRIKEQQTKARRRRAIKRAEKRLEQGSPTRIVTRILSQDLEAYLGQSYTPAVQASISVGIIESLDELVDFLNK